MPTVTFQVLEGIDKGRIFRDLPTPVTIGREEGNMLRLNDERASRFHAKVQSDNGEVLITDLESTNGTRVNGNVVQIRRLRPGDRIGIGRSLLLFGSEQEIRERMEALKSMSAPASAPDPLDSIGPSLYRMPAGRLPVLEECQLLWERLQTGHVEYNGAEHSELYRQILDPESACSKILARGFECMVLLDAAAGLSSEGFSLALFLKSVHDRVSQAFGLGLEQRAFHSEDIFQMLKDGPRSLFCFVNFQHIPASDFGPIRGFTQGIHQVLFFSSGRRDLHAEEMKLGQSDSVHAATIAVEFDAGEGRELDLNEPVTQNAGELFIGSRPLPPLPQKMTPSQAARLAELLDFFHRQLTLGTDNFQTNDEGTQVTMSFADSQRVLGVQMLLARYLRAVAEPDALDE